MAEIDTDLLCQNFLPQDVYNRSGVSSNYGVKKNNICNSPSVSSSNFFFTSGVTTPVELGVSETAFDGDPVPVKGLLVSELAGAFFPTESFGDLKVCQ